MSDVFNHMPLGFLFSRLHTRSFHRSLLRLRTIHRHYAWNADKFMRTVQAFVSECGQAGVVPTLPVTATVFKRHADHFQKVTEPSVEWAVHGYKHIDYTRIPREALEADLSMARRILEDAGIPAPGNRFPLLRQNRVLLETLSRLGFSWDSSASVLWNVEEIDNLSDRNRDAYWKIVKTYEAKSGGSDRSLPGFVGNMVEIPVSLPDDDMLIDRAGISDSEILFRCWSSMARQARAKGEAFVLQLHPERYPIFRDALRRLLSEAVSGADAWVVPLGEMARWWKRRAMLKCEPNKKSAASCRIRWAGVEGGSTAEIKKGRSVRRLHVPAELNCDSLPAIGVSGRMAAAALKRLHDRGYVGTIRQDETPYALVLDAADVFNDATVWDRIDRVQAPMLRVAAWPQGKSWAMSVTGDIDNADWLDFWNRWHG